LFLFNVDDTVTATVQNISSYEQTQASSALLKMLAQSSKSIQEGRTKPAKRAFSGVRRRVKDRTG